MCLTALGTVVERDGHHALVAVEGGLLHCSTLIHPDAQPGDRVLAGLGSILRRLSPTEAAAIAAARDGDPATTPQAPGSHQGVGGTEP